MPYIDIDQDDDVEIKFTKSNVEAILDTIDQDNKLTHKYSKEDIECIKKALEVLNKNGKTFTLEGHINDVYTYEEEYPKTYEDGYQDGISEVEKERKKAIESNGCLLQKLEHLAYGFGNQEQLTRDDLIKLREVIHG